MLQTLWALVALYGPPIGWWCVVTAAVNVTAHMSQIDKWCEARPRLAGTLKILRGMGFDPWLILQGFTLWAKGRLPEKMRYFPILLALILSGCAGSFEASRAVSLRAATPQGTAERTAALSARCLSLDGRRQTWGAIAKGSAVLAGASGVAAIPADSKNARIALATTGVAAAALAASAVFLAETNGSAWVEECE